MPKPKKPKKPLSPKKFYQTERDASLARKRQMIGLIARFDRLTRWLLILNRRQHRIEFEYTIFDESTVYLRFRGPIVDRLDDEKIFHLIDDRGDVGWWPQASSCKSGGIQLEVRFAPHAYGMDALRHELAWSLLGLLKRMPPRSEAAITEIPRLDSREIARGMWERINSEYEQGATVYVHGQPVNHLMEPTEPRAEARILKLRSPRIVRRAPDGSK